MGDAIAYRLTTQVSYKVDGSEHSAEYVREFGSEEDAADLLRSLRQGPLYVRYDPAKPSRYAIDPYRDVWIPDAGNPPSTAPTEITAYDTSNPLRNPVSIGQVLLFQAFVGALLYITPKWNPMVFWFLAGIHALGAVTTTGAYWWSSSGKKLPTWAGRLTLILIACAWMVIGRMMI